jgi:ubiquinone biosynthesis monooxygenase Coq7
MQKKDYIVRTELHLKDFVHRGQKMSKENLKSIKKGLFTLHNLELMAATLYQFQITKKENELNRQLIAAMCNEMTHLQDFQVKLYEYGFKPGIFHWIYRIIGFKLGLGSRILGKKMILKTGIWAEKKAVNHYQKLLDTIDWDDETRKVIEKDQSDEAFHIEHWQELLKS